jgi:predicted acylesterase/phospholipase RssA
MERNNVRVAAAAGTSMGSMVAALVAAEVPAARIADLLLAMDRRVVDAGLLKNLKLRVLNLASNNGLLDNAAIEEQTRILLDEAGISTFADLKKPLAVPAVDILTGELCVFTNEPELFSDETGGWTVIPGDHDLVKVLCASASYPLAIQPTSYAGRLFMDGGCRMNLPTPLFDRAAVDAVVGVGMIREFKPLEVVNPLTIAQRTMSYGARQLDRISALSADLYVNLPVSGEDAFQAGSGATVMAEARQMLVDHPVDWTQVRPGIIESLKRAATGSIANMFRGSSAS